MIQLKAQSYNTDIQKVKHHSLRMRTWRINATNDNPTPYPKHSKTAPSLSMPCHFTAIRFLNTYVRVLLFPTKRIFIIK